MSELLTVKQVQKILKLSKQTVYDLVREPGFPACRVGKKIMIRDDKLQEWIDNGGSARTAPDGRRA